MTLQLMLGDEWAIPIPLADYLQLAWDEQQTRAARADRLDHLASRIAECFASSLVECLDPDLKPPTAAQLEYATVIARDLGLSLPAETLRYRGTMAEFIRRFADTHKARVQRGR
jgi:hypothetical protein